MVRIASEKWTACPQGELDRLEARLVSSRLRHLVVTSAAAALVVASLAAATWSVGNVVWPMVAPSFSRECPVVAPVKPCLD